MPRSAVELWQGAGSRRKVLRLHGMDSERARARVAAWIDGV